MSEANRPRSRAGKPLVTILVMLVVGSCDRGTTQRLESIGALEGQTSPLSSPLSAQGRSGVSLRLSDAPTVDAGPAAVTVVDGTPKSNDASLALLARLPDLGQEEEPPPGLTAATGPVPPPASAATISERFPPARKPPMADATADPLRVVHYEPEGLVDSASHLAITFSEPMVSSGTSSQLAQGDLPVRLEPEPEGRWRWIGSRTLCFEPEAPLRRLPKATAYRVEIAAGTRSLQGAELSESVRWEFSTPTPSVEAFYPQDGPADRNPLIYVQFDQRVDPQAVFESLVATAGRTRHQLKLASEPEPGQLDVLPAQLRRYLDSAPEGRYVLLEPVEPFPTGVVVNLTFGPGLSGLEGPITSSATQTISFEVHGPLLAVALRCGGVPGVYGEGDRPPSVIEGCQPGRGLHVVLSNPLNLAALDGNDIRIEPAPPGFEVQAIDREIVAYGLTAAGTEYRLTLPAGLTDEFGQSLERDFEATFKTGDMQPALFAAGGPMIVLDPSAGGTLRVYSVGNESLAVQLYRVAPSDWTAFLELKGMFLGELHRLGTPPGEKAWEDTIRLVGDRQALAPVDIDLSPALEAGLGQLLVAVEPGEWSEDDGNSSNRPIYHWVQVTDLGLDVYSDEDGSMAWVTSLTDGRPLGGATVIVRPEEVYVQTDADGLARLPALGVPADPRGFQTRSVVARLGGDATMLPAAMGGGLYSGASYEGLRWFVLADRREYSPGDRVYLKGWLRRFDPGRGGDVAALELDGITLSYVLLSPYGEEISRGDLELTQAGGFYCELELPEDLPQGAARLRLKADGAGLPLDESSRLHSFEIAVSPPSRPDIQLTVAAEGPHYLIGAAGYAVAQARYRDGDAVSGAEIRWTATVSPTNYTPPGWDGFHFGLSDPSWSTQPAAPMARGCAESQTSTTDAGGGHRLAVETEAGEVPSAYLMRLEADVVTVDREQLTASDTQLLHPAARYVGLRSDKWFADAGSPFVVEAVVTDIEGAPVADSPVTLEAERLEWMLEEGVQVESATTVDTCETISRAEGASCTFAFDQPGRYRIEATVSDDQGRSNTSRIPLWVVGSGSGVGPTPDGRLEIVPSHDQFAPGDTARLLLISPVAPAEGLLTVRRSGIVETSRFTVADSWAVLELPIRPGYHPNVIAQVDLVASGPRTADDPTRDHSSESRPSHASGSIDLTVMERSRSLSVTVEPALRVLAPGGETAIDIMVTDGDGEPVHGAEVTLIVAADSVDAADTALVETSYEVPDPNDTFHPRRSADVSEGHQRSYLQQELMELAGPTAQIRAIAYETALADQSDPTRDFLSSSVDDDAYGWRADETVARTSAEHSASADYSASADLSMSTDLSAPSAAPAAEASPPGPESPVDAELGDSGDQPAGRAVAAFEPALATDEDGRARVNVVFPHVVAQYRITAVATDGATRFGTGGSTATTRLPVTVRPVVPRFLNLSDELELPVVVANHTVESADVDVVVRTENLTLEGPAARRVEVPAGSERQLRFRATTELPGTALVQAGAYTVGSSDWRLVTTQVRAPDTTQSYAVHGVLEEGAIRRPVYRPGDTADELGGLVASVSPSALSGLSDAYLNLLHQQVEGPEQVASRMLGTTVLADVLPSLQLEGLVSEGDVARAVRRDLERLTVLQNSDGGYGWQHRDESSAPFVSIHVAHALARAMASDYDVDVVTMDLAQEYLQDIETHLDAREISGPVRQACEAYALYALDILGYPDPMAARALYARVEDPSVETLGWLLYMLTGDPDSTGEVTELRSDLTARLRQLLGSPSAGSSYDDERGALILASPTRGEAVALEALLRDGTDAGLIDQVASHLLSQRENGEWRNAQENALALLSLQQYLRESEAPEQDFVARLWLGERYLGEATYVGETLQRIVEEVPLRSLPEGEAVDLTLAKDGPGRLYYRLGMDLAPDLLVSPAIESGFGLARRYEPIDGQDDVVLADDGSWQVEAGSRVRVRLILAAPSRRFHVALVDPLPAGFQPVEPDLEPDDDALLPSYPQIGGPGTISFAALRDSLSGSTLRQWRTRWYSHYALRHDRMEVFAELLEGGVYDYSYVTRAGTPGKFIAPAAAVQELYSPETHGRSATDTVSVR